MAAIFSKKTKANRVRITTPSPSPSSIQPPVGILVTIKLEPITPTLTLPPTSGGLILPPPSTMSLKQATVSLSLDHMIRVVPEAEPGVCCSTVMDI